MKPSVLILLGIALCSPANAHYLFGRIILDGKWTETWEYVREVVPKEGAPSNLAIVYPNTDPDSIDLRCGRGATPAWAPIKTATVQAGDTIGFANGEPMLEGDLKPWMYHPGFASAWLSKAPTDDLTAYDGDGDWFKILSVTGRTEQSLDYSLPENEVYYDMFKSRWGTYRLDSYNFTIPETTPPGFYLLRFEHIFPNQVDAQYYVNCAHIEVVSSGADAGTPGPLVQIPGVYERGQEDVYFSVYQVDWDIDAFVPPAPVVWTG